MLPIFFWVFDLEIQDGYQDGHQIQNIAITLVLEQLGEWFWCLCIGFWEYRIYLKKILTDQSICCWKIQDGHQDGRQDSSQNQNVATSLVLEQLGEWFWCLYIGFFGKEFISDKY